MELYLVRHAQRDSGKNFDILKPEGIEQSRKIGRFLKNKKFDLIYCSPQYRARQTLKEMKPSLKFTKIKITERARQMRSPEEIGKSAMLKYNLKKDTYECLDKRIKSFIKFLIKNHPKERILIISHKEGIKFFIRNLVEKYKKTNPQEIKVKSGSINYFKINKKGKTLDFNIGDISHLKTEK